MAHSCLISLNVRNVFLYIFACSSYFFFFQAEDGIRDIGVTGVQTCALPIWKVEEFHKSLKQNASLAKSPTRRVVTQSNHFFCCLCAFIKLESLKMQRALLHE